MKHFLFLLILIISLNCYSQSTAPTKVPLINLVNKHGKTALTSILTEAKWNELFPNRYGHTTKNIKKTKPDFYSFESFVTAARCFPEFLSGSPVIQKRELAAFLANIAQETSGGWANAPGGYFKWGLYFLEENSPGHSNTYNDTSKKNYPGVEGKYYYGRGPKQLTWNYNYGQFSQAWYGSKDTLLQLPDLLSRNQILSFASALWFWMTPQFPKPSCHDIMIGKWVPTSDDIQKGRLPGFGATVNVINGGIECGNGIDNIKTRFRYQYYQYFCNYFQVSPGDNISCTTQKPFNQ